MRALDVAIIALFLVGMPLLGVLIGGRQKSATDYFVSEKKISWWVVCVSVVSAETSTLTVLSRAGGRLPGAPAAGGMTYLTLALGYIVGRIVVSFVLLPRYIAGDLVTAYAFLGKRYGDGDAGDGVGDVPVHPAARRRHPAVRHRDPDQGRARRVRRGRVVLGDRARCSASRWWSTVRRRRARGRVGRRDPDALVRPRRARRDRSRWPGSCRTGWFGQAAGRLDKFQLFDFSSQPADRAASRSWRPSSAARCCRWPRTASTS